MPQVAWNSQHREEMNKLRKDEIECKQREAKLTGDVNRLESNLIDMKGDMDKLVTAQTELLDQVESLQEELEIKQEQLDDAKSRYGIVWIEMEVYARASNLTLNR